VSDRADDRHRALGMALAMAARDAEGVRCVVHSGDPASKARARVTRTGHAFTPAKTRAAQAALAASLMDVKPFTGNVCVAAVFRRSNRQQIDVDNLLKLVLDAATQAGLWADDSQVTAVAAVLEHDPDDPRTTVAFAAHQSTMARGEDAMARCAACGKPFHAYGQPRVHCSATCRMTLADPIPCAHCGEPFKKRTASSKYCSAACRGKAQRRRPCARCGGRVARTGSLLCRACWLAETGQAALPTEDEAATLPLVPDALEVPQ
jgi:Holliday junction resolvase RusA-like endonuclease